MGFRLQETSMTLNDLERQFAALSSVYICCDRTPEAISTRFSLALYINCLHIKFDDEIHAIFFEFQA